MALLSNPVPNIPVTGDPALDFLWQEYFNSIAVITTTTAVLASADFANQGTTTTVLHGNAAGNPSWGPVRLNLDVSNILPLANGGTNANLTASNGGIFYSTGTAGAILAGTSTAGQVLRSGSSSAPSWSTATYPATATTAGHVLRSDGTNFVSTALAAADLSNGVTGTGAVVLAASPTLTTPAVSGNPTGTVTSGTYTPTLTNIANVDASAAYVSQYIRVGNVVTVSGRIDVDATVANTLTTLRLTLPFNSAFTAIEQCGGTGVSAAPPEGGATFRAEAGVSNTVLMSNGAIDATNRVYMFSFTYQIL